MSDISNEKSYKFNTFEVHYKNQSQNYDMAIYHFHESYEVYFLLSGERNFFVDNRSYHVRAGDIVLINSNFIHKTTALETSTCERIVFNFNLSFFKNLSSSVLALKPLSCFEKETCVIRLTESQQQSIISIYNRIASNDITTNNIITNDTTTTDIKSNQVTSTKLISNHIITPSPKLNSDFFMAYAELAVTELLMLLNIYSADSKSLVLNYPNNTYKKVSEIVAYINKNYINEISLETISKTFFMSIGSLTKNFRLATGFSFTEYLNLLRMKQATYLLHSTQMNITEISQAIGYKSLTHFNRVFNHMYECSPMKYRKKLQQFEAIENPYISSYEDNN